MLSTLILFLAVSNKLSLGDIGQLGLVVGLASLAHQLTDAGFGNLMVRNSNQGGLVRPALLWLVRMRLKRAIWVIPLVVSFAFFNRLDWSSVAALIVLALCNSIYSLAILSQNAQRNWLRQTVLQVSNFLGFMASAWYFLARDESSIPAALSAYLIAWLLPNLASIYYLLSLKSVNAETKDGFRESKDARSFPLTLYANLFTTMAIAITTTGLVPELSGGYSQVQQLAVVFAPLSVAATNWFLPNLSRATIKSVQRTAHWAIRLAFPMGIVGAVLGWLGFSFLTNHLDYGKLSEGALILAMSASGLGVSTAVLTTCFIAMGKAETGAKLAIIQSTLTVLQVLVAIFTKDLFMVLLVELCIRALGFLYLYSQYRWVILNVAERKHDD